MKVKLCLVLMLILCNTQASADDFDAAAALAPFKVSLFQALTQGLADGPLAAFDTCQLDAQLITAAAQESGIRVGRTSHLLRNPENIVPDWAQSYLQEYLAGRIVTPVRVEIDLQTSGYLEPIWIAEPCLACHGQSIDAAAEQRVALYYPEDQAVGFAVGDFRGLFWLEADRTSP